jgi:NAD(P)-dependent dehydrogenase (short-subunit alcohol dehydrogenase family)
MAGVMHQGAGRAKPSKLRSTQPLAPASAINHCTTVPSAESAATGLAVITCKPWRTRTFPDADWHQGLEVYFLPIVRATRLIAPIMQEQGGGSIVNISTAWAFEPSDLFPTSAVFRAGLASYTKIFADGYAKHNVRMNNVLPGWIDSLPGTDERRKSVPMERYGTAEEIASVIAFLAGAGAGYITGQNLRVDGGVTSSV